MTMAKTTDNRETGAVASGTALEMPERAPAPDRTAQRALDMFQAKYQVKVLGDQKVGFTIPKGESCADVLRDATLISQIVYGRQIINSFDLRTLAADPRLATAKEATTTLAVDGNYSMERGRRYEIHGILEKAGKAQTSEADFLVAAAAYQLLTGKEFFKGAVHVNGGIYYYEREAGEPNKDLINKHSDQYVYHWTPLSQEHTTSIYMPVAPSPRYPSAAERAHANAMAEGTPTGDPDEAARQGRY